MNAEGQQQQSPVAKDEARERISEVLDGWLDDDVPHRMKLVSYYSKAYQEEKYVLYLYDKFSAEEIHFHFCDQFPFFTYINREIVQSGADEVTVLDHGLTQRFKPLVEEHYPDAFHSPVSNLNIDWSGADD